MPRHYFDLHCDTIGEIYTRVRKNEQFLPQFDLFRTAEIFEKLTVVFAIYSPHEMSDDEAYFNFLATIKHKNQLQFPQNLKAIYAVEGGKLLGGKIERFERLLENKISVFTLVWKDDCCIGGAHNTAHGLTSFGFLVLDRCLENRVIVDLSHASDAMFFEVAERCKAAKIPFIASHSNSRAICNHTRNITDEMFKEILRIGGILGVSFAPEHLSESGTATVCDVISHIDHFFSLGGEDTVCIGSDFDGISSTPLGLESAEKLPILATKLAEKGYTGSQIDKIFYQNAERFFGRYLSLNEENENN